MTEAEQKLEIRESDSEHSYIRFGVVAQRDNITDVCVYHNDKPNHPTRILCEFVAGTKKKVLENLIHGQPYIVIVNDKVGGVATTEGCSLVAPFDVFIDLPEED